MSKIGDRLKRTATTGGFIFVAVFCLFGCFLQGDSAGAQGVSQADPNSELMQGVQVIEEPLGLPSTDIRLIIARVIRAALAFMGIVVLVIILYAGFLWMTAGGNEEQIERAKKTLRNAVIGLLIILSAYAIVAFVMRMLGVGMGAGGMGGVGPPGVNNFRGSGALGRVIKDHYPQRNQVNVPRNTKIVITFFRPIRLQEIAVDTSNDGILGNCKPTVNNWETDCDSLNMSNNLINISRVVPATTTTGTATLEPISGAAILAQQTAPNPTDPIGIYTIVIRPHEYLGSETEDVPYLVRIGNDVLRDDADLGNPGIFDGLSGSKYYEWTFTCSTELDLTPPHVIYVYPEQDVIEYKNTVIQIGFNEPMDPIGIQGFFTSSSFDYYYLQNGFIYAKNTSSTIPVGVMNLVNNYQTLEFTPSIPCGKNACGGTIYCLPVCDEVGATCDQARYDMLLKAAITIGESTFESQPFTGVADICGNALDGDDDGVIETAPLISDEFDEGKMPNNYWWNFYIKNEMDLIPPIVSQVIPGPEAPFVDSGEDWSMWFDKRMRIEPMYAINIQESPTPEERCTCYTRTPPPANACVALPAEQCVLDLIWKVPFITFSTTTPKTKTNENHGPFLDGLPQGYIPNIDSGVEDTHFNCLYPGQGPLSAEPYVADKLSGFCDKNPDNCCIKDNVQVLCCNGEPALNNAQDCIDTLLTPLE